MTSSIVNRKAGYDYEIMESYTAGLVLTGAEVKSVKLGQASLKGAFVVLRRQIGRLPEVYLTNCLITPYRYARQEEGQSTRSRKLLVTKKEIKHLVGKNEEQGLTLVPLKLYTKEGLVKLDFAVARGKKKYDKREDLKQKDIKKRLRSLTR